MDFRTNCSEKKLKSSVHLSNAVLDKEEEKKLLLNFLNEFEEVLSY